MDKYENKKAELRAWAKDDIVPSDLQWLCKASAEIINKLQSENAQKVVAITALEIIRDNLKAENERLKIEKAVFLKYQHILLALQELFEQETFDTITLVAEDMKAENNQLKKEKAVEIAAAQKLCKIYFEIAEKYVSATQIRKLRDDKIAEAPRTEN